MLTTARITAKKIGQRFNAALKQQEDVKIKKMELLLEKKLDNKGSIFWRIFICGINGITRSAGIPKRKQMNNTMHLLVSQQS